MGFDGDLYLIYRLDYGLCEVIVKRTDEGNWPWIFFVTGNIHIHLLRFIGCASVRYAAVYHFCSKS